MPGIENVVADMLSRQFDDTAVVNTISHRLADVDLEQIAEDQKTDQECQTARSDTSLQLQMVGFPRSPHGSSL